MKIGISHWREIPGWAFILGVGLAVTVAVLVPYLIAAGDAQRPALQEVRVKLPLPPGTSLESLERGTIKDIIDADSINVIIDGRTYGIRYYGSDGPLAGQRCYREAVDRNRKLVGKEVLLLADAQDKDKNNILMRYVFTPDGTSVDATLVAEGFSHASGVQGRFTSDIAALEEQAKADKRGCLWGGG